MDVGLPGTLLLPILRSIRKSVQELRNDLSSIELRLVGSSLLIIYEGDWDRAEVGVQWLAENPTSVTSDEDGSKEEIYEDVEGGIEEPEGSEEESETEDEDEDEDEDVGSECPWVVRLIDFAHARFKPGQGPDLGVLKGLDTVLKLLDDRIAVIS
jgi:1D-myo-inositol-tetrakisphosphate 5-kinase/inositol-polyphosphate multikinase